MEIRRTLRTPLTLTRTLIEVALDDAAADGSVRRLGTTLLSVNQRHERLIDGLLTLASTEQGVTEHTEVDLADVARHVLDQNQAAAAAAGPGLDSRLQPAIVRSDPIAGILIAFLESAHDRFMLVGDPARVHRTARVLSRRLVVALAVLVGLVAACGDDDGDAAQPPDGEMSPSGGHEGASPVAEDAEHIAVSARSFAFEPEEITVQAGEDIAIVLSSEDSLHDFTIDELDAHVAAEEGATSVGGFRAEEAGTYAFYCGVEGHREAGMEGTLEVEE